MSFTTNMKGLIMKYDFIFYETDESFDYGDFPGGTCFQIGYHGFSIDISDDNKVDINTLTPFGDYTCEMDKITTIDGLKTYLQNHVNEISVKNKPIFEKLLQRI